MHVMVGKKLRELREKSGYTQKQLQDYLGVDQSTISKIESGDRHLKASLLEKLCSLYNCTPEYLLGQKKDYEPLNLAFRGSKNADLDAIAKLNQLVNHIKLLRKLEED